jgi:hypothetical protein
VRHEGAPCFLWVSDPGLTGSCALPDGTMGHWDVVLLADLPVHMITAGRKTLRPELDLHSLHGLLAEHAPLSHAYVERVTPGQATAASRCSGLASPTPPSWVCWPPWAVP